jgi:hypothetical protein
MDEKKLFKIDILKHLKCNHYLIPFVTLTAIAVGLGAFTMARTLLESPDVIINRRSNPRPWEKWQHDEYNLIKTHKPESFEKEITDPDKPKV